ncbi:transforming acidic coiled-coil-containing protein 1 [Trichonephila inaurata madagascariensis]|uniref:Transforming acidic coiled-coil-containing protein 1 n=1 Tax=Trichonephila inaurata madagascariensis TaxID=2747483 RepID=A0A8X7BXP5_9ARAC|nr:transforming acidic coiled-coil-containing protein 1 [Trichonephila inaurata madagascariensis]
MQPILIFSANAEIESAKKSGDAEVTVLRAQLKKAEMKISSLEKDLEQKNRENIELGSICDDLIAKVGKT